MYGEVWSIWMLIYFCMHLIVLLANFCYFLNNYFSNFPSIASVFSGLV
jgi:hypothetical protein